MDHTSITPPSISELTASLTYGTWRFQKNWKPLHVVDAEGCFFIDASGKRYLDFSAQLMCVHLGYKNQAVIRAIEEQARKLAFIGPGFATDVRAHLSTLLLEVLPRGLEKFFFTTSGTEANEAAFKIARMYTGKTKIIARYHSYHGSTMGSIAATGDPRRWAMEPASKIPGVIFAPEVHCYRCPLLHHYPECEIACVEYIDHMIENESDVAAVLVEPIVGTNGVLIPPKEYMPRLRQICDRHNVLLIADEVMTGWGRTGKWFAVDHWDVKPDILTTAKGITTAYMPLGLCATTKKIGDFFNDHYFAHGHTYEAHPLTLAPAIAAINEYKRLHLIDRAQELGDYLGMKLHELKAKHTSIGEVRGIGLFWAIELVKDRKTKEPFNTYADKVNGTPLLVDKIAGEMMKNGVFIQAWVSHFVIAPPLIITHEEIDAGVNALDNALAIADDATHN
ncbi:MAG: aspartate aminotransferase family protein [Ignavibacteriae bacterium]|nr:aspartate aminotransferase family protein [Ignavibacteria bacterium]MBI3363817.1 aspartate aminotransferase family protein [Ignavibacteriota bacterium]